MVAGFFVDVEVTVFDGSSHDVDSSEAAFKVAASMAFQGSPQGWRGHPEPIMKVEVVTPSSTWATSSATSTHRAGQINEMTERHGAKVIDAYVPPAETSSATPRVPARCPRAARPTRWSSTTFQGGAVQRAGDHYRGPGEEIKRKTVDLPRFFFSSS